MNAHKIVNFFLSFSWCICAFLHSVSSHMFSIFWAKEECCSKVIFQWIWNSNVFPLNCSDFGYYMVSPFSEFIYWSLCFIKLQSRWFICFWFSFFIHFIFVLLFIYFSFTFVFTRKFVFHPKIFALNNNVAKCDAMHIVQQKRTNNNKNVINLFRCFFFKRKWFVPYVFALYFILIFSLCQ